MRKQHNLSCESGVVHRGWIFSGTGGKPRNRPPATTTQETISLDGIYPDGTTRSGDLFTRMVKFSDTNYLLLDETQQAAMLKQYGELLNYFDPSVHIQLFLFNRKGNDRSLAKRFHVEEQADDLNAIRQEYSGMLKQQAKKGTNGVLKGKYMIFGIRSRSSREALARLDRIEEDVLKTLEELGCIAKSVGLRERLYLLYAYFHQDTMAPFRFSERDMLINGKSPRDYIAPMCFDFRDPKRYRCGDMLGSVFYFDIIAPELTDEVLQRFLDLNRNLTISIHMESMEAAKALKLVREKLSNVQKSKIDEQKKAFNGGYDMDILPSQIILYEQDMTELLKELTSSNQKLFRFSCFISCFGKTKRQLEDLIGQALGITERANCELKNLMFLQEQGMIACSPLGINDVGIEETLTTKCAAILIPFNTQELFTGREALYYGTNTATGNMVMADRKLLRTPNGVILGTPGAGKSFAAKREILGCYLVTTDDILICDPEREYTALVQALGGQVVRLATNSKDYLNPLDIDLSQLKDDDAMRMKADFVITMVDMIAGGDRHLEADERGIIDRCLRGLYEEYLKAPDPARMPTLGDLYKALLNYEPDRDIKKELAEDAKRKATHIANSLVLYVDGSQNYFNHRTNVDMNNRIVCFDIRDLGNQLKELGMLITQDAVWSRVAKNRELQRSTRYFCDEFHLLLREKQTAQYMVEMWKRFRKWGGIPTGITQNVVDFLRSEQIEGILGNSDFVMILNQSDRDKVILKEKLGLSNKQLSRVTYSEQGSGLIRFDRIIVPFEDHYPTDTKTYQMMNTRPGG